MTDRPSEAALREIIAGTEGVTPGPYRRQETPANTLPGVTYVEALRTKSGDVWTRLLEISWYRGHGNAHRDAAHIARCDPATVSAMAEEILDLREALVKSLCALADAESRAAQNAKSPPNPAKD